MTGGQRSIDGESQAWRPMPEDDLPPFHDLSMRVHPNYPERAEVLAEKFRLFPSGCFVLATKNGIAGYCFSHPFIKGAVPALDGLLGSLPAKPTTYYVHDLTLDEALRGLGQGRAIVPLLFKSAQSLGLSHLSLVAVNRRGPFWQAAGFSATASESLQAMARTKYDSDAVHMERQL